MFFKNTRGCLTLAICTFIYFNIVHAIISQHVIWTSNDLNITGVSQMISCDVDQDLKSDLLMVGNGDFTIVFGGNNYTKVQYPVSSNHVSVACKTTSPYTIILIGEESEKNISIYQYQSGSLVFQDYLTDSNGISFGYAVGIGQFDDYFEFDLITSFNKSTMTGMMATNFYNSTESRTYDFVPCETVIVNDFDSMNSHDEIMFADSNANSGAGMIAYWQYGSVPSIRYGTDAANQIAQVIAPVNMTDSDTWSIAMTVSSNRSLVQFFDLPDLNCSCPCTCETVNLPNPISAIATIADITEDSYADLILATEASICEIQVIPGDGTLNPIAFASPETLGVIIRSGCQITNLIDAGDTDGNGLHDLAFIEAGVVYVYQFYAPSTSPTRSPSPSYSGTYTPTSSPSYAPTFSVTPTLTPTASAAPTPSASPSAPASGDNTDQTTVIAASTAGGSACLLIVVAGIFWIRRKKKVQDSLTDDSLDEETDIAMQNT